MQLNRDPIERPLTAPAPVRKPIFVPDPGEAPADPNELPAFPEPSKAPEREPVKTPAEPVPA